MQYTPDRKPGGGGRGDQARRGGGFGDVAALHVDVGSGRTNARKYLLGPGVGLRTAGHYDPTTAGCGHPRGEEPDDPTQATCDDVGTVAAKDPSPLRRHHHATAPRARYGEDECADEFAGVLGRAHHPNRGGRLGNWILGVLQGWQLTV